MLDTIGGGYTEDTSILPCPPHTLSLLSPSDSPIHVGADKPPTLTTLEETRAL